MDGPMFPAPEFGLMALFFFVLNAGFIVLLVVLVVLAIRWLLRSLNGSSGPGGISVGDSATTEDSALALLRERFARGEIDADEYEQRRRTLGG